MLLFKSAIASLREKKEKQKSLETSIQKEEEKLLALEKEKDEIPDWLDLDDTWHWEFLPFAPVSLLPDCYRGTRSC